MFIVNDLWVHIIIVLIILNQNNFFQRGRGYNLSLTWDQPIANHNHPINSPQTQSSPAHMCSYSWCVSLDIILQERVTLTVILIYMHRHHMNWLMSKPSH